MTGKIIINGNIPLKGEVSISGAKNAVLKLMAASLLVNDICEIHNVPDLSDVNTMISLLKHLGAKVDYDKQSQKIVINSKDITNYEADYEYVSKMRASFNLLGALLGRCKEAKIALPGGCAIGERRIDFHVKGLKAMGAEVNIEAGYIVAKAQKLRGAEIYLDIPSVGATENLMLAAVLAEGSTIISNAAQEPEIVDLANFLNKMGADVSGAGTSEIVINGVKQEDLHAVLHSTIPDRIEAGTYIIAVAATKGNAIIKNILPAQITSVTSKLVNMGVDIKLIDPNSVKVSRKGRLSSVDIVTQPYPGFPTDMQSPMMSLLTICDGVSIITESLYENRFRQIGELRRMGADVQQEGNRAIIKGVKNLTGAKLNASDLRAGAALVIASLSAHGVSEIENLHHIDRGYENIVEKLTLLGADIKRINSETTTEESVEYNLL